MGWRTNGCADGVGCDDSQPTPLCIIQGQPLDVSFPAGFNVEGQSVRAEVRSAQSGSGRLILNMAPYGSVDPVDPTMLRFQLPAEATREVNTSGYYDVWVASQRIARGAMYAELSVSVLPPRVALAGSWTPIALLGEHFRRTISLQGLLPTDEQISLDVEHEPEFVVNDMSGDELMRFVGQPWLTVAPLRDTIDLRLSAIDIATIEPGRFSYVLRGWNEFHEPRTLLTGILLIKEGGAVDANP